MFNLFRKSAATPAPIADDIPDHKGFVATVDYGNGVRHSHRFATLKEAQIWTIQGRKGDRRYSIRNMETGKFAPYLWQLTRADLAH